MFNETIKEIHIEPTSVCNAECPMCARNINGKGLNPYITLKSLPAKWFEDNITPQQIKQLNKIFFCGNVGDPASAPELVEIAEYFKKRREKLYGKKSKSGAEAAKQNRKEKKVHDQTYGEHEENQKQIKKLRKEGK